MGELIRLPLKKSNPISKVCIKVEYTTLEDGSFWYRMYKPGGSILIEWTRSDL